MKRLVALVLTAAAVITFTACGTAQQEACEAMIRAQWDEHIATNEREGLRLENGLRCDGVSGEELNDIVADIIREKYEEEHE
jgi:hypothetical protein